MSYIQLISDRDNGAYYNVHFGDTIKFKQNSKLAFVSLDCLVGYSVNFYEVLGYFTNRTMKLIFFIGEKPNNSIQVQIKVSDDDFGNYDIRNISFADLLNVLNTEIFIQMITQYPDGSVGGYPVYNIRLQPSSNEEGRLSVNLVGNISCSGNISATINGGSF